MSEVIRIISGVLLKDDQILLCLRKNTRDYPNYWAFPVGHIENKENDIDAIRRELFEEIGIQMLDGQMLTMLVDNQARVQHSVFLVTEWGGEIYNKEPDLCAQVQWFSLTQLPTPLTPAAAKVLNGLSSDASKL